MAAATIPGLNGTDDTPPTTHAELLAWVTEVAELTQPKRVVFADGSDHDPLGDGLDGWHRIPPAEIVIIDGVTSSRRTIAPALTMALWVEAPRAERLRRVTARDGDERRDRWTAWMRAEERFFAADGAPDRADLIISGAPTIAHDCEREVVLLDQAPRD